MLHLLAKHLKIIVLWGVIFALLSGGVSLLFPKYYSAESTVLVISHDRSIGDPYVQSKSAELIGETLGRVMQTEDFYTKVMEQNSVAFDKSVWQNLSPQDSRQLWIKNVQASVVYGTSLLNIRAYSRAPADAINFASAVTQTAVGRGWEYVGSDVAFKIVDSPVASPWQTRPNITLNMLIGFAVGAVFAGVWVARYKRHTLLSHL